MDERQPALRSITEGPTGRDHVFRCRFDILQEPKFWVAMAFGLAPIVIGIIIWWSSR
jgi:hypothetical protein